MTDSELVPLDVSAFGWYIAIATTDGRVRRAPVRTILAEQAALDAIGRNLDRGELEAGGDDLADRLLEALAEVPEPWFRPGELMRPLEETLGDGEHLLDFVFGEEEQPANLAAFARALHGLPPSEDP